MSTTALRKSLMAITVAAFCAAAISLLALAAPASAAGTLINEIPDKVQITGTVKSGTVHCYEYEGCTRVDLKSATITGSINVNDGWAWIYNKGKSYVKGKQIWLANGGEIRGTGTLYSYADVRFSDWGAAIENDSTSSKYPFTLRAYDGIYSEGTTLYVYDKAKVYAKNTDGTAVKAGGLYIKRGYVNAKGKYYGVNVDGTIEVAGYSSNKIYAYSTANSKVSDDEMVEDKFYAAIKCDELINKGYVYAKASGKSALGIHCLKNLYLTYTTSTTKAYAKNHGVGISYEGDAEFSNAYVVAKGYNAGILGLPTDEACPALSIHGGKVYAYGVNTKDTKVGSGICLYTNDPFGVEEARVWIDDYAYVKVRAKSSTKKYGIKCEGSVGMENATIDAYAKSNYAVVTDTGVGFWGKSVIKVNGKKKTLVVGKKRY